MPSSHRRVSFAVALLLSAGPVTSAATLDRLLELLEPEAAVTQDVLCARETSELAARRRLVDYFASRPALPYLHLRRMKPADAGVDELARRLMAGVISLESHPPVQVGMEHDWTEDPLGDRNWRAQFHSMRFLQPALEVEAERRPPGALALVRRVILDWIADNPRQSPPSEFSWHDGVTAHRCLLVIQAWQELARAGELDEPFVETVLPSLAQHARLLADDPRYNFTWHNHGIFQARALLDIALVFPELRGAGRWRERALRRIEAQARNNVSAMGVHLEQAPEYHFTVLSDLVQVRDFVHRHGLRLSADFDATIERMVAFGEAITKPDGSLPMIGDTERRQDAWSTFGLEALRSGAPVPRPSVLYPKSGYCILRALDEGEPAEHERFAVVDLGPPRKIHGHDDALSFVFSAYGDDLIVDSGKFNYDYGSAERNFAVSARAHNLVSWHRGQAAKRIEQVRFVEGEGAAGGFGVARYPGVVHRRWVLLVAGEHLLVLDELSCKKRTEYRQLFHLRPDSRVILQYPGVRTDDADRANVVLVPLKDVSPPGVSIHEGTRPSMQGWVSSRFNAWEPNAVVVFRRTAKRTRFATVLHAEPAGRELPSVGGEVLHHAPGSAWRVRLDIGGRTRVVHVQEGSNDAKPSIRVEEEPSAGG